MTFEQGKENEKRHLTKLIEQCWENEDFKKRLVANPVGTMESFFGRALEANKKNKKVVVNDQTDTSVININIPPNPQTGDMELTDEQLEAVAGGDFVQILWTAVCWGDGDPGDTNPGG